MPDELGRRTLMKCGAACALASSCGKFVSEPIAIEAGAPVRGVLSVPMARVPDLVPKGGSVLLHVDASDYLGRRVSLLVANTSSQGLRAYQGYCTHSGCELSWVDRDDSVECPCHLSRFSVDGAVTHPPATLDLDTYPVKQSSDGQTLIVAVQSGLAPFPAPSNGVVTFPVSSYPTLQAVGGSVSNHAYDVEYPLLVIRSDAQTVLGFDARCPHLGCAVQGVGQVIICPCHGSLFGLDGTVKQGPATANLRGLDTTFDGSFVSVRIA
ncbi:MAG TPA: Rieske (2Fe-2S) protein [Myxococcales bacterium]|nr:Rieske (2Fe-2S) protein [Myxococcales bacterium]